MRTIKPMLLDNTQYSEKLLDRIENNGVQPKIDGVRLLVGIGQDGTAQVVTRSGKSIRKDVEEAILNPFVKNTLLDLYAGCNVWLDCELVYDKDCASSAGVLHSKNTCIDFDKLELYVFDLMEQDADSGVLFDTEFVERLDNLKKIRWCVRAWDDRICCRVWLVPTWTHTSHKKSIELTSQWMKDVAKLPYEGYVLKRFNSVYEEGVRSKATIKYKVCDETELRIASVIAQEDTQGNEKDLAGVLVCWPLAEDSVPTDELKPIRVTCSCPNELRRAILANEHSIVGRKIKVRFMPTKSGKQDGTLRMPRYIEGLEDLLK